MKDYFALLLCTRKTASTVHKRHPHKTDPLFPCPHGQTVDFGKI